MIAYRESTLIFEYEGARLLGVLHSETPDTAARGPDRGRRTAIPGWQSSSVHTVSLRSGPGGISSTAL